MKKQRALLIIDLQKESFPQENPAHDRVGVVQRINSLSRQFRTEGLPVIIVQHNGSLQNEYIPGTTGWELIDDLETVPSDLRIDKTANDSFYNTNLHELLTGLHVRELVITGSATDFCIDSTVQNALVRDYDVVVASDGHTATSRPHATAEVIVKHYNWVWENLTPTKGKVVVKKIEEITRWSFS
jgi:nicotinamidase-related amidase